MGNGTNYNMSFFPTKAEKWTVKGHFAPYIIKREYRDLVTRTELEELETTLKHYPITTPYDEVMNFYRLIRMLLLDRIENGGLKQFRYDRLITKIDTDFNIG